MSGPGALLCASFDLISVRRECAEKWNLERSVCEFEIAKTRSLECKEGIGWYSSFSYLARVSENGASIMLSDSSLKPRAIKLRACRWVRAFTILKNSLGLKERSAASFD